MPQGRRGWHSDDTLLYYAERCMSVMRVAGVVKIPLREGQRRGADMDAPARLDMPELVWEQIQNGILLLADVTGINVAETHEYHKTLDTTTVAFARRRGET